MATQGDRPGGAGCGRWGVVPVGLSLRQSASDPLPIQPMALAPQQDVLSPVDEAVTPLRQDFDPLVNLEGPLQISCCLPMHDGRDLFSPGGPQVFSATESPTSPARRRLATN